MVRIVLPLVICMVASPTSLAEPAPAPATTTTSRAALIVVQERLPDMPGIGVAAAYAGESNGSLLVAGGTNFPDAMPWQGGKKAWSDKVYAWSPGRAWREIGKLARPAAGGACATTPSGIVCAGGADATEVFAETFLLRIERDRLVSEPLPPLPEPLAGSTAVAIGSRVFILGGHSKPDAMADESSRSLVCIDLAARERRWVRHPPLPGPGRHLAVVATDGQSLYAFSGMRREIDGSGTAKIRFLRNAYKYDPGRVPADGRWQRLADLPRSIAAAPSPAPVIAGSAIFLGGGVDAADIVAPMDQREDLNADILAYDLSSGETKRIGRVPVSVVVAPTIPWRDGFVIATGEVRAGVRTPQVWMYRP